MANPYASEAALFLVGMYMVISFLFHANMFQPKYVEDRVVLVTDSTSTFGRRLTLEYARMHAKLFLVGLDEASLANVTVDCLKAGAHDVASLVGDVRLSHVRRSLLTATQQRYGQLHYLIMNHAEPSDADRSAWNNSEALRDAVEDHLMSHVDLAALALPSLKASRGHVAVVSSMAGKVSLPHLAGVSAVKAAIGAYFAAVRQELRRGEEYVSVTSVTVAYMDGVDGSRENMGRWGRLFGRWGMVKVEDAVAWIAHSVGGRKKEVTYPFAAQCHSVLHSWFPSLYEDPHMPSFNHLLPSLPLIST